MMLLCFGVVRHAARRRSAGSSRLGRIQFERRRRRRTEGGGGRHAAARAATVAGRRRSVVAGRAAAAMEAATDTTSTRPWRDRPVDQVSVTRRHVIYSGVARNLRQGVRQSVAFLSVHSRSAALPSRPYTQKTSWHHTAWIFERTVINSYITKSNTKQIYVFSCTPLRPLVWLR